MPLPRPTLRRKLLPQKAAPVPVALRARVRHQTRKLGAQVGFAQRIQARGARRTMSPGVIAAAAVLGCLGGVGLFLGWLQASLPLALGGACVGAVGAWLGWRAKAAQPAEPASAPGLDSAAADRLDALIDAAAADLPADAVEVLNDIAAGLGRMAPRLHAGMPAAPWRSDDSLFLGELLRRYIPDSVQHYLDIPAAQRASIVLAGGQTASAALVAQLQGLKHDLAERETRLAQAYSQALLLQGAFLEARRKD